MRSREPGEVGILIASARRELEEARGSLSCGEDCSAALARAAKRRDEAIFALLDARESGLTEPPIVHTH